MQSNESVSYQEVNSYTFAHSLPMLTRDKSRIKLSKINQALTILVQKYQSVVVEGSFGLLTPMAEGKALLIGLLSIKCLLYWLLALRKAVSTMHYLLLK